MSEDTWKDTLSPEAYRMLRQKGTEAPFTGALLHEDRMGIFTCGACNTPLFKSDHKFESGSGWPSFYDVYNDGNVKLVEDVSHGMKRVEVQCATCGGHLGHLFNDAYDQPTGARYCINSASLKFAPIDEKS